MPTVIRSALNSPIKNTIMSKYVLIACLLFNSILVAQVSPQVDQQVTRITEAVQTAGHYAATVLISENGASRCDYEMLDGQWLEYEPAWHTGQVIYGLLEAYRLTKDTSFLTAARKAGDWWISLAITDQPQLAGFLAAVHGGGVRDGLINFTTIADGTPGLFELSRVTDDPKYADVATRAGAWGMEHLFIPEEGLLYDIIDLNNGEIWTDKSPHFPADYELTVHDVARPNNEGFLYADMFRHTGNERYYDFFVTLCNSLVDKQSANGFWMDYHPNNRAKQKIHPRFNLWNAESLLVGYELSNDERYLEAALRTARAVQKWQRKDGRMYYTNRPDGSFDKASICGSAVAFAGLLWLELQALGYDEFDQNIERSLAFVLNNQFPVDHPDPNLRGAFLETWSKTVDGEAWLRVRDVATSFGLRFLVRYHDLHQQGVEE
ncbi:MAG: beta-L-arabinofuranosidase domain-containing protein [Bacteroidota bacterium]